MKAGKRRSALMLSIVGIFVPCTMRARAEQVSPQIRAGERTNVSSRLAMQSLRPLFGHIWRAVGNNAIAPGTIYIFLPDGKLLETSCVETYRIATWSVDAKNPGVIRVTEDRRPAFDLVIRRLSNTKVEAQQHLLKSGEQRELALEPATEESVCPDLRK